MKPEDLARELSVSGKKLRDWLRKTHPRTAAEHGTWWYLSTAQVAAARRNFG